MAESFELKINDDRPVDVDVVLKQIREYILTRNLETAASENDPTPHLAGPLDMTLYKHLDHANVLHNQLAIAPRVVPVTTPIIGQLLTSIRSKFHELMLFYVNQLAQKQNTFNAHVVGVLNGLVREVEELRGNRIDD
jgi:hypothetical protein